MFGDFVWHFGVGKLGEIHDVRNCYFENTAGSRTSAVVGIAGIAGVETHVGFGFDFGVVVGKYLLVILMGFFEVGLHFLEKLKWFVVEFVAFIQTSYWSFYHFF